MSFIESEHGDAQRASMHGPGIVLARLAAGFAQGLVLYWLYHAASNRLWPASAAYLFHALLLTMSIVPPLFITGLGYLRKRALLAWLLAACATLVLLASYGVWRGAPWQSPDPLTGMIFIFDLPLGAFLPALTIGMLIAHALVIGGCASHRLYADYREYFEASWRLAIQFMFSTLFALVFWLLLVLGGFLLQLVNVELLSYLSKQGWFLVPGMSVAFACALHVTDVRPGIVHGIRGLLLALLSWLLPLVALIVLGFLACLPWTGLAPLWATRHATLVLIGMSLVLLLLINAVYEDGQLARRAPLLRACVRAAGLSLLPLVGIAARALALRVEQHGWTSPRIVAACFLIVLGVHAAGYAYAVLRRHGMDAIASTNTLCAFLAPALLLALMSPLADPARLSVASQMARLESGRVSASRFDYAYVRQHGARYGTAALEALRQRETGPDAALVRQRADEALRLSEHLAGGGAATVGKVDVAANLHALPAGTQLPRSLVEQDWRKLANAAWLPLCMTRPGIACDAFLIDFDGDGKPEVLLLGQQRDTSSAVLAQGMNGQWRLALTLPWQAAGCAALRDALAAGGFRLQPHAWRDLDVLGSRIPLKSLDEGGEFRCPDGGK
jgi:hypothetical protein